MDQAEPWIGLIVAAISAAAALAAWRAAAGSRKAAAELTAIERDRRHAELTPQLVPRISPEGPGRFRIRIQLDGPLELGKLDRVVVSVRNDTTDHTPLLGDVTPEQANAHIWGPLRFIPGVDGASADGRQVGPVALGVGDDMPFVLGLTSPPLWNASGDAWWHDRYHSGKSPVRLAVRCEKDGEQPWVIPIEVSPSKYEYSGSAS